MIEINSWLDNFLKILNETFKEKVWFVGLQGSYARHEATKTSDIDIVVILDEFNESDISIYNKMLDKLSQRELICGFISGKNELLNWEPSDLFQFYYDTIPLQGSIDELIPLLDSNAIERAIKTGVCNIYHGCVHNMLHEKSEEILKGLYKSASFTVQAICFKQTGNYISQLEDLIEAVSPDEQVVVEIFINLKKGGVVEFDKMSRILFNWAKKWIVNKSS